MVRSIKDARENKMSGQTFKFRISDKEADLTFKEIVNGIKGQEVTQQTLVYVDEQKQWIPLGHHFKLLKKLIAFIPSFESWKGSTVLCPSCKAENHWWSGKCLVCDSRLAELPPNLVACWNCSRLVSKRAETCPGCDTNLLSGCIVCNNKIPANSEICPLCGDPIPFEEISSEKVIIVVSKDGSIVCPNCSSLNSADVAFCQSCNFYFNEVGYTKVQVSDQVIVISKDGSFLCPNCETLNSTDVAFCQSCKFYFKKMGYTKVKASDHERIAGSVDGRPKLISCTNCGHGMSSRATECPMCNDSGKAPCEICSTEISRREEMCPNCGDPDPFGSAKIKEDLQNNPETLSKRQTVVQEPLGSTIEKAFKENQETDRSEVSQNRATQAPKKPIGERHNSTKSDVHHENDTGYFSALHKYAVFTGRSCRKEYWTFTLVNLLIMFLLGFLEGMAELFNEYNRSVLATIFALFILFPSIGVTIRRLHDTGRSGYWILLNFIPIAGAIVLFIFCFQDSESGENQYGPNPKIEKA